ARGMQFAPLGAVPGARYIHVGMRLPGGPSSTAFRSLLHRVRREANGDAAMKPPAVEHDEELPSFVVCTSGTTADPKAVVHTRRSLRAIVAAIGDQLALGEGDVMYARDLHLLLPALFAGARIVIPRERSFDAHVALRTLASEGVTHAFLVTRDCRLVLDACLASAQRVPDTLRSLLIGAAPVRTPFLARFREVLPAHTVAWCVYGATEVLPVSRVSLEDKLAYAGEGDLVGTVMSGVSVRTDEHGELWVKGDRLFTGYAGSAPVAEHATGDLARIEDDRIVLLGRAKDMIIRGEHNIYPALYEPLVERVPGVRRAAMVGDYDSVLADERVILVVEPEQGVDEHDLVNRVWRAVRGGPLRLDSSAQPDRIIVRALPETGRSHKVDKNALRRQLGAALP
ncbi:MAG: class I adenylate-forming enzyme family protein, partial [Gemmatimonas sp.]